MLPLEVIVVVEFTPVTVNAEALEELGGLLIVPTNIAL
jgi:hypothetical protein